MNVIVSNKYAAMLSNLNIDLIKSINGEFDADELVAQFDNFFFNKMILDITAIKDYQDITKIQELSVNMVKKLAKETAYWYEKEKNYIRIVFQE